MYICVTHVDAATKIPCTEAPMSHGPSFPEISGLKIEWANWTAWPTETPMFFGTCDEDADTTVSGVVNVLTEEQYNSMRESENSLKSIQVRNERDYKLRSEIDSLNPIRWEALSTEQQDAWKTYREELLAIPQQEGFPWDIKWPVRPDNISSPV